jgi:hypothetical protein
VLEVCLVYFHLFVSDQCQWAAPVTTVLPYFLGVRKTQRWYFIMWSLSC